MSKRKKEDSRIVQYIQDIFGKNKRENCNYRIKNKTIIVNVVKKKINYAKKNNRKKQMVH